MQTDDSMQIYADEMFGETHSIEPLHCTIRESGGVSYTVP
jgi:hypothetical protein